MRNPSRQLLRAEVVLVRAVLRESLAQAPVSPPPVPAGSRLRPKALLVLDGGGKVLRGRRRTSGNSGRPHAREQQHQRKYKGGMFGHTFERRRTARLL
jgi:hypothetical protein